MIRNKKILRGLNHIDYEHPHDRKALRTLENTPGLGAVGKYITKHTIERIYSIQYTGSNIQVTKDNYPRIYEYLEYACEILDIKKMPALYLQWGYDVNACTIGSENSLIILNSGLIDLCDDDEILFILGHECGHIKSDHMLYHMMAQIINTVIDAVPFGTMAATPLKYALYYWSRMSEFTADRAGLLCCQNKDAAIHAFMKIAGVPVSCYGEMNDAAFINQAKQFKLLDYEAMNSVAKVVSIADSSHPWTVMRAAELLNWIGSSNCESFLRMND